MRWPLFLSFFSFFLPLYSASPGPVLGQEFSLIKEQEVKKTLKKKQKLIPINFYCEDTLEEFQLRVQKRGEWPHKLQEIHLSSSYFVKDEDHSMDEILDFSRPFVKGERLMRDIRDFQNSSFLYKDTSHDLIFQDFFETEYSLEVYKVRHRLTLWPVYREKLNEPESALLVSTVYNSEGREISYKERRFIRQ